MGALPAFFVFPFIFDSPKMNESVAMLLAAAAFFSPIVGFLFAEWPYRRAAKAQQWRQAFGWTLVPVLLPASLWLTLNGYLSWASHQAYEQRFVLRTAKNVPVARLELGPSCQDVVSYSRKGDGVSAGGTWTPSAGAGAFQCEKWIQGGAKANIWISTGTSTSLRDDANYRNLDTAPPRLESIKGGQVTVSSYQISGKLAPDDGKVYSQVTGYVFRTEAGQLLGEATVSRPLNGKGAANLSLAVVRAPGIRAQVSTAVPADQIGTLTPGAIHEHVKALEGYLQSGVRDPK
jgi:hypothetical protein